MAVGKEDTISSVNGSIVQCTLNIPQACHGNYNTSSIAQHHMSSLSPVTSSVISASGIMLAGLCVFAFWYRNRPRHDSQVLMEVEKKQFADHHALFEEDGSARLSESAQVRDCFSIWEPIMEIRSTQLEPIIEEPSVANVQTLDLSKPDTVGTQAVNGAHPQGLRHIASIQFPRRDDRTTATRALPRDYSSRDLRSKFFAEN